MTIPTVPRISDVEKTVALNLRQTSACGQAWARQLLEGPGDELAQKLAELIADSGVRGLRENEENLRCQVQAQADELDKLRRALETLAANAHIPPRRYTKDLRQILIDALGRAY